MQSLFFDEALLPQGFMRDVRLVIEGRVIATVETGVAAKTTGDERHAIGLPGMPNLHSHAFQRGMAGLAEIRGPASDSFWTWREVMYRFAHRMNPDDVEAMAAQLYVEMLEAGFTRVGEFHYLHHDHDGTPYADIAEMSARIAAAADSTGIGLTLLPVFYAHGGFGGAAPNAGQRRFINDFDGFARLLDGARRSLQALDGAVLGVAPHSLRAATKEELAHLVPLAGSAPIHIHVAEQTKEVEDCVAWSGARPVEWLLAHAPVDHRWCLIHATHMTPTETEAMAKAGAVAGLCPITEANLGDGIFPATEFVAAGGEFGVGSDSNVLVGLPDELRQLEYSQRLRHRARNVMAQGEGSSTGRALYDAALAGGSRALGVGKFGIAPGAPADIISLDATHPALISRRGDAILDGMIFAARDRLVDCVWRGGRKLVEGGRHRHRDICLARFRAVMEKLLA
jgi:formiminoglutamate deiminase